MSSTGETVNCSRDQDAFDQTTDAHKEKELINFQDALTRLQQETSSLRGRLDSAVSCNCLRKRDIGDNSGYVHS